IIHGNCDFDKFYYVAEISEKDFNIKFTNKLNDFDTIYWDFSYNRHLLTLHYNIYLEVSIHPEKLRQATTFENDTVVGLGQVIFNKLVKQ
ncbi:MAG TPA: hypothetical protein VJ111_12035, partial [Chitinophagaceae bacterium]|nr:hypothetical protein [Chitinophagaceae bacterium]